MSATAEPPAERGLVRSQRDRTHHPDFIGVSGFDASALDSHPTLNSPFDFPGRNGDSQDAILIGGMRALQIEPPGNFDD